LKEVDLEVVLEGMGFDQVGWRSSHLNRMNLGQKGMHPAYYMQEDPEEEAGSSYPCDPSFQ